VMVMSRGLLRMSINTRVLGAGAWGERPVKEEARLERARHTKPAQGLGYKAISLELEATHSTPYSTYNLAHAYRFPCSLSYQATVQTNSYSTVVFHSSG
jgi:hypothetical protein